MNINIFFALFCLAALSCTGCGTNGLKENFDDEIGRQKQEPTAIAAEKEKHHREFCTVKEILDDAYILENVYGELYYIDDDFLHEGGNEYLLEDEGEYQEGDPVLLIYFSRQQREDGTYSADVYAVYPDSYKFAPYYYVNRQDY